MGLKRASNVSMRSSKRATFFDEYSSLVGGHAINKRKSCVANYVAYIYVSLRSCYWNNRDEETVEIRYLLDVLEELLQTNDLKDTKPDTDRALVIVREYAQKYLNV